MRKILLFLLLVTIGGGAAAYLFYIRAGDPYRGYSGADQFVEIPQGAGSRVIGEKEI